MCQREENQRGRQLDFVAHTGDTLVTNNFIFMQSLNKFGHGAAMLVENNNSQCPANFL